MPTEHIIAALIAERDKLNRAIDALQGPLKRRGRPPKNPYAASVAASAPTRPTPSTTKHYMRSTAARKAQSARMKAYWAKRRKAEKK